MPAHPFLCLMKQLKIFQDWQCLVAARLGMDDQGYPMRTWRIDGRRVCFQRGFDDLKFSEHRRGEDIKACAMFEQEIRDVPAPHMGRGAEGGLKVSATPVPCGVDQCGLLRQQFPDAAKAAVRIAYKFVYQCSL